MIYTIESSSETITELALFPSQNPESRTEAHAIIKITNKDLTFSNQFNAIINAIENLSDWKNLRLQPVFIRLFLSDISNQQNQISLNRNIPIHIIGQPPLDGSKIATLVILESDAEIKNLNNGDYLVNNRYLWSIKECSQGETSFEATQNLLESLESTLKKSSRTLADNCLRTWFFVRDIDTNYSGVVEGRNRVFQNSNLTRDTHFIASTGIGGSLKNHSQLVSFNSYCDLNTTPEQIKFITGASHLNPTIEYGVAFERATAIDYASRRRLFVSGTASINNKGEIMYPGDIRAQTKRMIENILALLNEAECSWSDTAHFIVYLRDASDYIAVKEIFSTFDNGAISELPIVIVLAPVCRPGWLIETECMAIAPRNLPEFPIY